MNKGILSNNYYNLFCVSLKNDNSNLANFAIVTIYLDKNIHN